MRAVADHLGRLAAGGGHHPVADDQQPVVGAGREPLDDDCQFALASGGVGGHHLLAGGQVRGHAAALAAVLRLDDHRQADLLGGGPGVFGVGHRAAFGHRHADGPQQRAGQFLVLGDRFGDGAGAVGLGGQDAVAAASP